MLLLLAGILIGEMCNINGVFGVRVYILYMLMCTSLVKLNKLQVVTPIHTVNIGTHEVYFPNRFESVAYIVMVLYSFW